MSTDYVNFDNNEFIIEKVYKTIYEVLKYLSFFDDNSDYNRLFIEVKNDPVSTSYLSELIKADKVMEFL